MDYQDFLLELTKLADDDYRDFVSDGTPTDYPFLGVRLPYLRDLAKRVIKSGNPEDFLSYTAHSFEEITTQGIVIASLPYDEMLKYLADFVKKIDNWGTCDTFCNTLKSVRQHREDFLPYIDQFLQGSEFEVRVGLVILLSHYTSEPDYVKAIFDRIDQVKDREEYYIKMAVAWLVAECFIKHQDVTWDYLASDRLPKWTQNKAISKIRDSYRVSLEVKDLLKEFRK